MFSTKRIHYEQIRPYLKTGDLILFSGTGPLAFGIKMGTFSKWSHVGMVVYLHEIDMVCLWESTTLSNLTDMDTEKQVKGVQLVSLHDRISSYDGDVAVRHLLGFEFGDTERQCLQDCRKEFKGVPYEKDEMELLHSASIFRNTEDLSSLFCSELVAETYQRLGLLSEEKPSNEYVPADFAESRDLLLEKGHLDAEVEIFV